MRFLRSLLRKILVDKKPLWAAQCKLVYTDRHGRRYYQYQDESDMSVYRKGEIEKCLMELRYGSDYSEVLDGLKKAICNTAKGGFMSPDIATAGYLVQELFDRKGLLAPPEILFRICANILIREDENPYLIDQEILEFKIDTFKEEIQRGGLHDFFQQSGLLTLIGLSNISKGGFIRLMNDSEQREQQVGAMLKLLTSEQRSPDSYNTRTSTTWKKESTSK